MSAAVQRSERHGSINWEEEKVGWEMLRHLRQTGFDTRKPRKYLLDKVNEEISDVLCVG